jgi:anti-anti-sigma factor
VAADSHQHKPRRGLETFSLAVEPDVPRVRLVGSLDLADAARVAEAIAASGCTIVDCRELSFLDTAGANALVTAHRSAEQQGIRVIFSGIHGEPLRVLEITGLNAELNLA